MLQNILVPLLEALGVPSDKLYFSASWRQQHTLLDGVCKLLAVSSVGYFACWRHLVAYTFVGTGGPELLLMGILGATRVQESLTHNRETAM